MKKLLILSLLALPLFIQCGKTKSTKESEQSIQDSTTMDTSLADTAERSLQNPTYKIEKIDKDLARTYVSNYRRWIRIKNNPISLCKSSTDTLKWLRLVKKEISNHIGIDTARDLSLAAHDGIRIYPSIDEKKEQNYILVYTKKITGRKNAHADDLEKTFLLRMKIPDSTWCKLHDEAITKKEDFFTSHHMCEPDCGQDDAKY